MEMDFNLWEVGSDILQLPRSFGFELGPVNAMFAVEKLAMRNVFFRILLFAPVSMILPTRHTHLHLQSFFQQRDKGVKFVDLPIKVM
jgi:hypothetical protein